jgi:putative endonuclease
VKSYWVYIMTGPTRTLYVGVTNDIQRRDYEHKKKLVPGFTSKYRLDPSAPPQTNTAPVGMTKEDQ